MIKLTLVPSILLACVFIGVNIITLKANAPMTTEDYAEACGLSYDEFVLFSSVVEAESDRSRPEDGELTTEGRVLIAVTIYNRYLSGRFPDTITGVLTQRGQFSTVRNGQSVTQRTEWSDRAVYEAVLWCDDGTQPHVFFFNCIGYNTGTPYDRVGGNYFMVREDLVTWH